MTEQPDRGGPASAAAATGEVARGAGPEAAAVAAARAALSAVMDPEIPTVSIVDLGMLAGLRVAEGRLEVDLLPTFLGCPALDIIADGVRRAVGPKARIRFLQDPPWSTDRITAEGRRGLAAFGIAPPEAEGPHCPRCGGGDVLEENLFGPTRCRSIFYCRTCRQPFEAFKAI